MRIGAPPAPGPEAKIVKKTEFAGAGAGVQLLGVVCCFLFFPIGLILGIILLIVGGRMAIVAVCSECRGKVDAKAKLCQHCGKTFV